MKHIFVNKKAITLGTAIILLIIIFIVISFYQQESAVIVHDDWSDQSNNEVETDYGNEAEIKNIMVDIKGEINKPGVYEAIEGERVVDLVKRAGGLTANAAEEFVNFAMYVEDEMVIYIPKIGDESDSITSFATSISGSNNSEGKINLNKATEAELETLSGIGPAKATAIIEYREANGSFKTIEDLMLVSGIGEKTFEKIADQLTVK